MSNAKKGTSQDALGGLRSPEVAGVFAATGRQSVSPATVVERFLPTLGPTNSLPGVSATLEGGESPYAIPAEAGLDFTKKARKARRKRLKRTLRRALKNANNKGEISAADMAEIVGAARSASDITLGGSPLPKYVAKAIRKVERDPVAALSRLEVLASGLKATNPARMRAAALVLRSKLLAHDTAASTGSVRKAVGSLDPIELWQASVEVERALGMGGSSAAPFSQGALDADTQLRRILHGGTPQSLRGTQAPGSVTGGPAATLGLALKGGLGEDIVSAEKAVKEAAKSGDAGQLAAAEQNLTFQRLKAAHRAGV